MLKTSEIIKSLSNEFTPSGLEELETFQDQEHFFTLDTRKIEGKNSFIAFTGDNFNPLKFLDKLDSKNISHVFYEENEENQGLIANFEDDFIFVGVKNSLKFLQGMAREISAKFQKKGGIAIGICGSNGKTTTKDILVHLLKEMSPFGVVGTEKNNNNHIGVPLTIFELNEDTKFLACELGSNHPGEMQVLLDILNPNVGVSTNIGKTHLEFFENLENVFKEESLIYKSIKNKKGLKLFLRNDLDDYLSTLADEDYVFSLGEKDNDFQLDIMNKILHAGSKKYSLLNESLIGEHNVINMGVCASLLLKIEEVFDANLNIDLLEQSISSYFPQNMRSEFREINGVNFFVDAYNANPSSMIASLESYKEYLVSKNIPSDHVLLVVGDMNELGSFCEEGHKEVANYIEGNFNYSAVVFIGRFADFFNFENKSVQKFNTVDEFKKNFIELTDRYKNVFLKASRSVRLEKLLS